MSGDAVANGTVKAPQATKRKAGENNYGSGSGGSTLADFASPPTDGKDSNAHKAANKFQGDLHDEALSNKKLKKSGDGSPGESATGAAVSPVKKKQPNQKNIKAFFTARED